MEENRRESHNAHPYWLRDRRGYRSRRAQRRSMASRNAAAARPERVFCRLRPWGTWDVHLGLDVRVPPGRLISKSLPWSARGCGCDRWMRSLGRVGGWLVRRCLRALCLPTPFPGRFRRRRSGGWDGQLEQKVLSAGEIAQVVEAELGQELRRGAPHRRAAGGLATAFQDDQLGFQERLQGLLGERGAADFLDLGAGDGLVV